MGNISGWTEGIILTLVFVAVLTIAISNFNVLYDKDNSLGFTDNTTEQLFIEYQQTTQDQIEGGDVAFDADQGITLKSSYGMAKDGIRIVNSFLTGGFIERAFEMIGAGEGGMALARGLRILYVLSLIFALLYALFKIAL